MNYYPVPHDAVPPRDIFEGGNFPSILQHCFLSFCLGPEQDHLSIGFTGYDTPEEQLVQPCSSWENLSPQRSDPISPSDSDSETTFSPIKITGDELVLVKEIAIDSSEQRELNPQEKAKILDKLYPSDDQYRQALRGVLQSLWYQKGTLEPQGELSDFIARRGQRNFACTSCHREYKRADRAIAHFRTHIEHRPFKCAKALGCGDKSWLDTLFLSSVSRVFSIDFYIFSNMAFFTNDCLKSHCRKQEKTCKRWYVCENSLFQSLFFSTKFSLQT